MKNKKLFVQLAAFVIIVVAGAAVFAFTGPSQPPPDGEGLISEDSGNIGIGIAIPVYRLDVQGGQINASGGLCIAADCKASWDDVTGSGGPFWFDSVQPDPDGIYTAKNVVIGGDIDQGIPYYELNVFGNFAATIKNFDIPHPLDPDNKRLAHSTLEGPEIAVFYRGESELIDGKAEVILPDYFEALTGQDGRTVLLTPKFDSGEAISNLAASAVKNGKFSVRAIDNNNQNQKFYWSAASSAAGTFLNDGWHFVGCVYDDEEENLTSYVDGVAWGSTPASGSIAISGLPLTIGATRIGAFVQNYFNGSIDDVRIYDRALSADEIFQLYNGRVYERSFAVENVNRDVDGDIDGIDPPINDDPSTQKITAAVQWDFLGAAHSFIEGQFIKSIIVDISSADNPYFIIKHE